MSTAENQAAVRRWVEEGWNQGHLALVDELYAPDYALHDPSLPQTLRGIEPFKQFVQGYRGAIPDIRFTIEQMLAEGDTVVWRWTARGTHRGDLMGIPPTGKTATVTGITISRFANGRWAEDWLNWDTLGLLQQLGVIPATGQAR